MTSSKAYYTKDRFNKTDQERLAAIVKRLDRLGCKFMMTNADVPLIRELYQGFYFHKLNVARPVSCKNHRYTVGEWVITNYIVPEEEQTSLIPDGKLGG